MKRGSQVTIKIENKLDGLSETITITDDYLIYTLESKEYNFK